jgi:hypothetical protein
MQLDGCYISGKMDLHLLLFDEVQGHGWKRFVQHQPGILMFPIKILNKRSITAKLQRTNTMLGEPKFLYR